MALVAKEAATKDQKWKSRIDASRRCRDKKLVEWRDNRRLLYGTTKGTVASNPHKWRYNLAWAAMQTTAGKILSRVPEPIVRTGGNPLLDEPAKVLTAACQQDLDRMEAKNVGNLAIGDVYWAGFGMAMELLQNDIASPVASYTQGGGQRYSLVRIHPESFYPDPTGTRVTLEDFSYCGFEFYPTVAEVRDGKEFTISDEALAELPRLRSSPYLEDSNFSALDPRIPEDADPEFQVIRCVEIWDRKSEKIRYMAIGSDEIMGEKDWPVKLRHNGVLRFPVALLYFNQNPDEFYPIPEISIIKSQIESVSALRKQAVIDAITKFRRYLSRGTLLQKGHQDRIKSGGAIEVIEVDDTKWQGDQNKPLPLDQIVRPIEDPHVQQDVLLVADGEMAIMHQILGAGDFASAGFRNTRSATEAAALSDFLNMRTAPRVDSVDTFYRDIVINHCLFLQETVLSGKRKVQIQDEAGVSVWREVSKTSIKGDFEFAVMAGSSRSPNTDSVREQNIAFFQQIAPIVLQSGGNIRPMLEWLAPFYKVPVHMVDAVFGGLKQSLSQVALMMEQQRAGGQVDPNALMEAMASAVMAGLTPSELASVAKVAQQTPGTATPQGGPPAQAQPGGMPGTNPSDQLGAPQ